MSDTQPVIRRNISYTFAPTSHLCRLSKNATGDERSTFFDKSLRKNYTLPLITLSTAPWPRIQNIIYKLRGAILSEAANLEKNIQCNYVTKSAWNVRPRWVCQFCDHCVRNKFNLVRRGRHIDENTCVQVEDLYSGHFFLDRIPRNTKYHITRRNPAERIKSFDFLWWNIA